MSSNSREKYEEKEYEVEYEEEEYETMKSTKRLGKAGSPRQRGS